MKNKAFQKDIAWKTMFKIVERTSVGEVGPNQITGWMPYGNVSYEVRDNYDNLHGTYNDYKYAKKQARHKYKKFVKSMERSLMDFGE